MITTLTPETNLKPAQGMNLPILLSQHWYSQHSDLNFVTDLNHYLFQGQVLSTDRVFAIGKVVQIDGEKVFFVRFAWGEMEDLAQHLPDYVKEIVFCRRNRGNLRKYSIDRLKELSNMPSLTSPIFSMHDVLEGSRFCSAA